MTGRPIKLAMEMEDVLNMRTTDEKMNALVRLGFMNYERIDIILGVLNGNGKVGICEQVRGHSRALRFLWTLFVLVSSALAGALFTLLRL